MFFSFLLAAMTAAAMTAAAVPAPAVAATYFAAGAVTAVSPGNPVEVLPSGVRIEHLVRGEGARPTVNNVVTVNYRGKLVDNGFEFDSSYKRGKPASFALLQVIPCWTEGMQRIAAGGRAVLVCPASTAYGSRGAGTAVPADADLRFEVDLLSVH